MSTGVSAVKMRPSPKSVEAVAAERTIVEGLCYLEREADRAALKELAITIRAALDIYSHDRRQECKA